nr:hypothetical protein CFP56_47244 [Quercus suber]
MVSRSPCGFNYFHLRYRNLESLGFCFCHLSLHHSYRPINIYCTGGHGFTLPNWIGGCRLNTLQTYILTMKFNQLQNELGESRFIWYNSILDTKWTRSQAGKRKPVQAQSALHLFLEHIQPYR